MFNQGITGVQNQGDGQVLTARFGRQGDQMVSELHGRYYEAAYRKALFHSATAAAGVTTVGLATTYTGFLLTNPIASTVNLSVHKCTFMQSVIQATTLSGVGLAVGYISTANHTATTAGSTPKCSFLGGPTPQGITYTVATLSATPTYYCFLANSQTAILNNNPVWIDLEGALILPPGGFVMFTTAAVSPAASMWFAFDWEEVAF